MAKNKSILDMQVPLNEESPLKQYFDKFDIENIGWSTDDYKLSAMQRDVTETTHLLIADWKWRKEHRQNVVASIDGPQGGGKSMPFSYIALMLGKIFGVPFTPEGVYFSVEELDEAIQNSVPCQTFFKDEDPKTRVGLMSHMLDANIADYEEQLRINQNNLLQAGVELRNHAHFFWFESKHTIFDKTGYPVAFFSMLKTPRYTDRKDFVWRGFVRFPMPNKNFVEKYLERKQKHNENLKAKYGNTLNPVSFYSQEIFNKRKQDLIQKTKDGFIKPLKRELMDFIVAEEIGTRRFTNAGYDRLVAQIRAVIINEFEQENSQVAAAIEVQRELQSKERDKVRQSELDLMDTRRQEKMEFMKEKLAEEKRKNDLKERQLKLKEKAIQEFSEVLKKKKNTKGLSTKLKKQLLEGGSDEIPT